MRYFGPAVLFLMLMIACRQNKPQLSSDQHTIIEAFKLSYEATLEDRNPDSALLLARQVIALKTQTDDPDLYFDALTAAGLSHERMGNPDSSEFYYQKAVHFANEINEPQKIAFALQLEANNFIDRQNYLLARQKYADALIINKRIDNQKQVAANYAGLGLAYSNLQQSDSSIAYYLKAASVFKSENDSYNQAVVYGNIAAVYVKESLHPKAEPYLRMAIDLDDSLQNLYNLGRNYNTLGTVFSHAARYDSARHYFQKAIDLSRQAKDDFGGLMAKFNLGKAETQAGNYADGEEFLMEVFDFCENNDIAEGKIRSLLQLGENLRLQGNFLKSENYFKQALTLTRAEKQSKLKAEALIGLSKLAVDKTFSVTQNYLEAYQELTDSLSSQELKKHIQELESSYHSKEKEARIDLLEENLHNRKNQIRLWIAISILAIISFLVSILYFSNRQKQLRILKIVAEERSEKAQLLQLKAETEAKLKTQEAAKNALSRKMKTQEIIHQAEAYGKLISTIHEIRVGLNEFKLKFRARKDTEAFDRILLQIDKANGLNPLNDLMNAFKDLQPEFYTRLSEQHPELSPRELEICALISLNMTSKQISVLLNITIKSVEVARHRIRKKINLHPDQNLTTEIMQLLSKN